MSNVKTGVGTILGLIWGRGDTAHEKVFRCSHRGGDTAQNSEFIDRGGDTAQNQSMLHKCCWVGGWWVAGWFI